METIKTHIGIFDFWSVFGVGVVIVTSYCAAYFPQVFTSPPENMSVWLYVPLSYTVGLVLFCASSIMADIKPLRYNADSVAEYSDNLGPINDFYYKRYFKGKSYRIAEFKHKYDELKLNGLPSRIDKLHSIYSMTRGIAFGFFCLTLVSGFVFCNFTYTLLFFLLSFAFYVMSKKYLFRWMEWVFQESKARESPLIMCVKNVRIK